MTSKDSDQPVQPFSMVMVLVYPSVDSQEVVEGNAISEDSEQTAYEEVRSLIVGLATSIRLYLSVINLIFLFSL